MKSVITLSNVSKSYKMGDVYVDALKNIDLKINKGDFLAITGASGSGKSTMMNLVGCLDVPTEGCILLKEQDITHLSESELAQIRGREIGFIFQQFNLIPTLSALENVALPLEFQNVDSSTAKKTAYDLLHFVGLGERASHLPSQLSGGQMQRVAIARALAVNPEIILADEPTGNLDSNTGKFIMDFLKRINRKGKTIILVTHDLNLVGYADRVIRLKDGLIEKKEVLNEK